MNALELKILESVYTLSDDVDYNLYEAVDIAEYAHLEEEVVQSSLRSLYEEGYLGECMSLEDDGMETFHLTHKGMAALNATV